MTEQASVVGWSPVPTLRAGHRREVADLRSLPCRAGRGASSHPPGFRVCVVHANHLRGPSAHGSQGGGTNVVRTNPLFLSTDAVGSLPEVAQSGSRSESPIATQSGCKGTRGP